MQIESKVNIHNRFDIEVRDAITGELKQEAHAFNIVLDKMYTQLCGLSSYFNNIHFGTGMGTLAPSRTTLFTHLGTKTATTDTTIKALPTSSWKRKIVLNPEEFVGSILTEVGISYGASSSNLVTHAMLKDSEGNPISITKTATDVITIYATVFITMLSTGGIVPAPASTNEVLAYLLGGSVGMALYVKAALYGNNIGGGGGAAVADVANKRMNSGTIRLATSVGNGPLRAIGNGAFSALLSDVPGFINQSYSGVAIGTGDGVKTAFKLPSKNIIPESLVIKANGVPVAKTQSKFALGNFNMAHAAQYGQSASSIYLSGNGKVLFCGSTNYISVSELIEPTGWAFRKAIAAPWGTVLASSYDGNRVAIRVTGGFKILDWNGTDWIDLGGVYPTAKNVNAMVISKDNNLLYVATGDGATFPILAYTLTSSSCTFKASSTSTYYMYKLAVSDDGSILTGIRNSYVLWWRLSGETLTYMAEIGSSFSDSSVCLHLSSDGTTLVHLAGYTIRLATRVGDVWTETWTMSTDTPRAVFYNLENLILIGTSAAPVMRTFIYDPVTKSVTEESSEHQALGNGYMLVGASSTCIYAADTYSVYMRDCSKASTLTITDTPPANGVAITADYTVDGVHKTDQFVIDMSYSIQFGEPT